MIKEASIWVERSALCAAIQMEHGAVDFRRLSGGVGLNCYGSVQMHLTEVCYYSCFGINGNSAGRPKEFST